MAVMFTGASDGAKEPGPDTIAPRFVEETEPPAPSPAAGIEGVGAVSAYDVALSRVLAALVAAQWRVQRFRNIHLPDGLLDWKKDEGKEVTEWMHQHGPAAGEAAAMTVTITVAEADVWRAREGKGVEIPPSELLAGEPQPLSIKYVVPGEAIPREQRVKKGTALDDMRTLLDWLLALVPWTEPQASVFVLTEQTPIIAPFRVQAKVYGYLATLPRLALEVDPRVTQREIASVYQTARAQLASDIRHRDLSEKHLALATFATLPEGQEGSLAERMARWNEAQPAWAYHRTSNFSRDVTRARQRLLRDLFPHPWGGDKGEDEGQDGEE
ncbi:MAG TPA: hypothetical protein VF120_16615 [Ktedonobacterales bacterium]